MKVFGQAIRRKIHISNRNYTMSIAINDHIQKERQANNMCRLMKVNPRRIHFPYQILDFIFDIFVGHDMYSFMDGYSGYN